MFEESRDSAGLVEDWDEDVLLAVCEGGESEMSERVNVYTMCVRVVCVCV